MLIKLCILFGSLFAFKTYTIYLAHRHLLRRGLPLCRYICCGRELHLVQLELFLPWVVSFIYDQQLAKEYKTALVKTGKGVLSHPPMMSMTEAFSLLYFNKTLLHKSSEWSSLVSGPRWKSKRPRISTPFTAHSLNLSSWGLVQDPKRRCELSSITSKFG